MINEERGEFEIELEGATYGMRPSFEAIQAFEGVDGLQLLGLAEAAGRDALSINACSAVVTECVKAWGREVGNISARGFQAKNVGPLLLEAGMMVVQRKLALMLYLAATGGITASGEVKAALMSPTKAADVASAEPPARSSGGRRKRSGEAHP